MSERFSRTELLLGAENMERLSKARVAIFGIGGVGGYVAEALARCGVGSFVLVDSDRVCESNLNRQIIATEETIGEYKTKAMRDRIRSINPEAEVEERRCFFLPENAEEFDFTKYSYVVDAVDTVTAKLQIISQADASAVPVISCMGAGNKLDPTKLRVADIYETSVCPLAKVMRRECRKRGIRHLKVVYSTEEAIRPRQSVKPNSPEAICLPQSTETETAILTPLPQSADPGTVNAIPTQVGTNPIRLLQIAEPGAVNSMCPQNPQTGTALAPLPQSADPGAVNSIPPQNPQGRTNPIRLPQGAESGAVNSVRPQNAQEKTSNVRRSIPGSVSFVPSAAGLILAGEVIKDLCNLQRS